MIFILICSLLIFSSGFYSLLQIEENPLFKGIVSGVLSVSILSILFSISLFLNFSYFVYLIILVSLSLMSVFLLIASGFRGLEVKVIIDRWCLYCLSLIFIGTTLFTFNSFRWGKWDAWAIWNLHAKFLSHDGWSLLFTNKISWTHPDYPLMLPSLIAVFWKAIDDISPVVPVLMAYLVYISVLSLIYSSINDMRFKFISIVGVMFLSLDSNYITLAASQYADTLLSLFILITVVLVSKKAEKPSKYFLLIGLFSSLTIWVKNEGIVFFILLSMLLLLQHYNNTKKIFFYLFGALPVFFIYIYFKIVYAPLNVLVEGQDAGIIQKILSFERYKVVIRYLIDITTRQYPLLLVLFFTAFFFRGRKMVSGTLLVLISTLILYLFVYIITPLDIEWHVKHSLDRLLHQLYPSFLYCFLLILYNYLNRNPKFLFLRKTG